MPKSRHQKTAALGASKAGRYFDAKSLLANKNDRSLIRAAPDCVVRFICKMQNYVNSLMLADAFWKFPGPSLD
jgi:hypothetical protein